MSKYYLGIDQSKRSTGCVLLDSRGELHSYLLVGEAKLDNEELIIHQFASVAGWLGDILDEYDELSALIEGLAFGSVGSGKDFLAGLQWYFRARFFTLYGFLGTVPVSMWRSKVLTKEEQREAKLEGKNGLKLATVRKLPMGVLVKFEEYVAKNKFKKDSLFDLNDAYHIAKHCFNLSISK